MHRVSFNGLVDVPFGKGRHFLKNSNRLLNALIGGYQIAFVGTVVSQSFQVATGNYGATSPIKLYKSSVPVTDCRSGVCRPAYMWFNGYLAPTVINAATRGVQGVPSDYQPYLAPINNTPGTPNFGNNNVADDAGQRPAGDHRLSLPAPAASNRITRPSFRARRTSRPTFRSTRSSRSPSVSDCGSMWTPSTRSISRVS